MRIIKKKILPLRKVLAEMDEINKELREQAKGLGMCEEWQGLWNKDWSKEKMAEMMYRGLDFCLEHHFPTNDFIQQHFEKKFLRENNIFVNDRYSSVNPEESLILGKSEIRLRYNSNKHGIIHVRDNSTLKITAKGRSFVIIHLYEKAYVDAEKFDSASVVVIKHSTDVTVIADSNIKVKEEYDYLKR